MNTITRKQYAEIWKRFDFYTENENVPDFWSMYTTDASGEQCPEESATYAVISVQDFDGKHDLDFLRLLLNVHGVELNERDMLDSFDLNRLEQDGEERPLKAAFIDGDGIYGRLYEYELILRD